MAKAKTSAVKPKVLRGRLKSASKAMKTLGYRVTGDYLDWLGTVASANRTSISGPIDQAVAKYARDLGVTAHPPDRTA
jgi:hypothetical protein